MSDEQNAAIEALDSAAEDSGAVEEVSGGDVEGSTGGANESELPEFQPFTWEDGDQKYTFSRRAELTDWLSKRQKDRQEALRKAQERAQHFEKRMGELSTKEQTMQQAYSRWARIDEAMKKNPQVAERIQKAFEEAQKSPGNPDLDRVLEERLKPVQEKLSKYEQAEQKREQEQLRQKVLSDLRGSYEDFDESSIAGEINRLQSIGDDPVAQQKALYELIYHAMKGKQTPASVERKFAEQSSKRRPPSVTSTPGRGKGEPDVSKMSKKEAREYAMQFLE